MEKTYQPGKVEKKIYAFWEKGGWFTPQLRSGQDSQKKPFTIIMPPPNANAPLHIGHALFATVEDIMIRYHRMLGQPTLWLPGADHAGILTQVVFERKLIEKGLTRDDLGRNKFFAETMKFTLANKKTMENQLRALGASCDWTRNSFTLDPKFDRPIYTVFKRLYDGGLIFRAERMINWCPRCQTALSDLEVEHKETKSKLWYLKYPLKSKKGFIIVATTRPETMLGDTAVAVNPKDKRYKALIGQTVILPLMNREIPVIADKAVDSEFGTGAVKITPAHDPVDFEIGQNHRLKIISVIGFDNHLTRDAGRYAGLETYQARKKVLIDLKKLGLLKKEEPYTHSVGHCERCKTIIEPLVSLQWFVKAKPLAKKAMAAVKQGKIKIVPKKFEKIYFNWMKNIQDWCISRQIWWGHQFPVWYCPDCGKINRKQITDREVCSRLTPIVSISTPKDCPKCGRNHLYRDPDTLDTWFSSGQWPFNTLGWIDKSSDFKYFYPTSVMETGYEILFFWVARMIMLGIYVTGKIPFKTIYLHGLVRDAFGQKMSKSLGNVIDPLPMVEKYGADALRLALTMGNAPGSDSSLSENKIAGMRNFSNKIWNAARFVLTNREIRNSKFEIRKITNPDDKWILKETNKIVKSVTDLLNHYRFDLAIEEIYQFFWHTFCDKYLERFKVKSQKSKVKSYNVLFSVMETSLILLHPFMPFITEEIWQKLPGKRKPLIISEWPEGK